MLLKASAHPKYDPHVQEIQRKLNSIKHYMHGNWLTLETDGLFGNMTKQSVIGFQIYKNITPVSGEIGYTTLKYINEEYNRLYQLRTRLNNGNMNVPSSNWKATSGNIVVQLANLFNDVSDNAIKQIKWFQQNKIETKDIDMLVRNAFEKPNVKQIREEIEKNFFNHLDKEVRRNDSNYHYHRKKSNLEYLKINETKRQLSKRKLNVQNQRQIEKQLAQKLSDKVIKELESINFNNKISIALKNIGVNKISGGGLLKVITLIPIFKDIYILIDAYINEKSTAEPFNKLFSNIISFIEGILIGFVVGAVVATVGIVGWTAVVIIIVISIIVGIILELIFPMHSEWLTSKIIASTKKNIAEFHSVIKETATTPLR